MDLEGSCGRPAPVGVGPARCGRHPVATMLIALPLMLATSCSTLGPNIAAADEVAVDFHRSIQDSDGGAACALLAPATVEEVESTGGRPVRTRSWTGTCPTPTRCRRARPSAGALRSC